MSDQVANGKTSLGAEEVIVRAVQYFSSTKWRPSGQSGRTATFQGMPPIPWFLILVTVVGLVACIVPGILCYILLIQKARRFHNLVVTANPLPGGTEVVINYPEFASSTVDQFMRSLPPLEMTS